MATERQQELQKKLYQKLKQQSEKPVVSQQPTRQKTPKTPSSRASSASKHRILQLRDGLTKQYFIDLDYEPEEHGKLYKIHVKERDWLTPFAAIEAGSTQPDASNKQEKTTQLFHTEVDEKVIEDALHRLNIDQSEKVEQEEDGEVFDYFFAKPQKIRENLIVRAEKYYLKSVSEFEKKNYELAIEKLNKAFCLQPANVKYYLLKLNCHLQLCDFKSSLLTINKILSLVATSGQIGKADLDELKQDMNEKTIFCHYMMGQTFYDTKLYMNALESFNKASEMCPDNLAFKMRSISCMYAMNRYTDSLFLLNKIINDYPEDQTRLSLYVLRARINLKNKKVTESYYDLKAALAMDPNSREARSLMDEIQATADGLRNTALILSLSNRVKDALVKINSAIRLNPDQPEYLLQRGILYKRMRDFNSCIEDFLVGLEKIALLEVNDEQLVANFRRQILLTYNEFSIVCYEKGFYDEGITLLEKAIRLEKNEKGFYINRGDCFNMKGEKNFALLDYEQAAELDPQDEEIKNRIAKIYYEYGVSKYDEKNYEESTNNFTKCIEYAPGNCKYYISRARTKFFCGDKNGAQLDICISILLDPLNPEIPPIIARIFVNQNLSDVLDSVQMQNARHYLKRHNIKSLVDANESLKLKSKPKEVEARSEDRLQPTYREYVEEEKANLEIIEKKNEIKSLIKDGVQVDLNSHRPLRLQPPPYKPPPRRDPKGYMWRKFSSGIGAF